MIFINGKYLAIYLCIQENELYLEHRQQHPGRRRDRLQDIGKAIGIILQFKIASKFESRIDHTPNSESWNDNPDPVNCI